MPPTLAIIVAPAGKDDEDDKFSSERVYESINFQTCGFYKLISFDTGHFL
jgi:hypothetical protein